MEKTEKLERLTYSIPEMAQVLGIGTNKAYDLIHINGFPVIKFGNCYRIPKEALQKWLNEAVGQECQITSTIRR